MNKMKTEQVTKLGKKLPEWAIKQHPTKKNMSVIHPMAVIERLNEVFGVGGWNFETDFISCDKEVQKTTKGERNVYVSAVRGRLTVESEGIKIEQFGGNTNDDKGDTLKGGATDALTKCASYLGIGAEIYKGHGNIDVGEVVKKGVIAQNEAPDLSSNDEMGL
jgi:hypothetical protein